MFFELGYKKKKIKEMIEKYPALKIQYEKFIEIYNLIKDDHKDDLDVI